MAARTYELSEFLVDVLGVSDVSARYAGPVAYQPACHQLRMLKTDPQARALLAEVGGAAFVPLADEDACCGFGGLFSLEMAEVSAAISERKARTIEASRAALVVTGETGCLLQMAGALARRGSGCQVSHLAELLAGTVSADTGQGS
jgi:L-lactate dehydrogenase complex protein LldE